MNQPPRCLTCEYVLIGLERGRCPECGREFDCHDPKTYTTKPLFVRWKFWLPGFVAAVIIGFLLYVILLQVAGWGVAVTLVAPFSIGALIGYGCPVRTFARVLLTLIAGIAIVTALFSLSIVGIFCGLVLAGVAVGPLLIGTLCGVMLREVLKHSNWEQRWHLPVLALLLAPVLCGFIERAMWRPRAVESVVTSLEIRAPVGRTWDAVMFYEEVRRRPPWLLRLGLPRPLYTRGSVEQVGDRKACVYTKGRLTKEVTERVLNERLMFTVVEQDRIENHSVRLTGGSFVFTRSAPDVTTVELTTSYQPKLGPRWVWRPFEWLAVHTLHRHVLEGMRLKAEGPP